MHWQRWISFFYNLFILRDFLSSSFSSWLWGLSPWQIFICDLLPMLTPFLLPTKGIPFTLIFANALHFSVVYVKGFLSVLSLILHELDWNLLFDKNWIKAQLSGTLRLQTCHPFFSKGLAWSKKGLCVNFCHHSHSIKPKFIQFAQTFAFLGNR